MQSNRNKRKSFHKQHLCGVHGINVSRETSSMKKWKITCQKKDTKQSLGQKTW